MVEIWTGHKGWHYCTFEDGAWRVLFRTGPEEGTPADEPNRFDSRTDAMRRVYALNGWRFDESRYADCKISK